MSKNDEASGEGHNSGGIVAADQLRAFVERVENLEEEKSALAADIRAVYGEAKASGFDAKIVRQVVTLRKMDANERDEQRAVLDLYLDALGL